MQSQLLSVLLSSLTLGLCLAQLSTCPNEVPAECPVNSTVTGCSTCCCASSDNVEFYVPSEGEPNCTAPAAVYEVRFEATWTSACHPDYYFSSAHWSPLTGISHKPEYELWDACMYDVSPGVAQVSQTGSTVTIKQEYSANAEYVLESFSTGVLFPGAGTLSANLGFDSGHQYVSVVTMLAPSLDRMMGVSSLRLCDGNQWKDSVKLCGELFSTATKTDRVSDGRNTIQYNNCSFGYFIFTLLSVEEPATTTTAPAPTSMIPVTTPTPTSMIPVTMPTAPNMTTCGGMVPAECPVDSTVTGCSTCCCASSDNVEFYVPSEGEPSCTAPPAVYEVRFEATWTAACHPDYYFSNAHWSPLTGISHKPEYELWDACMYDVSPGVAQVSQTGSTVTINQEYSANAEYVLESFSTSVLFPGAGTLSAELDFDSGHQYISVVTMLAPSLDRMMGVSSLRLCDGSQWKESVKLCGELFSTATKTDRVSDGRNTIQYNNCSFGYFIFTLLSVEEPAPTTIAPTTPDITMCGGMVPAECPVTSTVTSCSTCCCASSDNVEFYVPSEGEPSCTAPPAVYEVRFEATWTAACHPDYYFSSAHWSPLTGISHKPEYELWDACMYDVSPGVAQVSQTGSTSTIKQEYSANAEYVLESFSTGVLFPGAGTLSANLDFDSGHQYVSVVTMLAPSLDRMMGVSSLRLCDGSQWKDSVKLCGELFSTATKTNRVSDGRNSIQYNNCSFGYFIFNLLSVEEPTTEAPDSPMCGGTIPECAASPPASVTPQNCPTCCCSSSDNVEFYQDRDGEPACTAPSAVYQVKLEATWTQACHPDYYYNTAHWSPFTGISHSPEYELWDACMKDVSPGVATVSQTGNTVTINQEYNDNSEYVLDTFTGQTISGQANITAELDFDCGHQYVSVVSMLAPSADQMIGVSLVRLCNGSQWKQSVKLCAELFSTATRSNRVSDGRNSIQYNNCSFGYFEFTLLRTGDIEATTCNAPLQASPSSGHHVAGSFVHFVLCQLVLVLIMKLVLY